MGSGTIDQRPGCHAVRQAEGRRPLPTCMPSRLCARPPPCLLLRPRLLLGRLPPSSGPLHVRPGQARPGQLLTCSPRSATTFSLACPLRRDRSFSSTATTSLASSPADSTATWRGRWGGRVCRSDLGRMRVGRGAMREGGADARVTGSVRGQVGRVQAALPRRIHLGMDGLCQSQCMEGHQCTAKLLPPCPTHCHKTSPCAPFPLSTCLTLHLMHRCMANRVGRHPS